MKKLREALSWLLFTALQLGAAYGMLLDIEWATNLLLFLVWLGVVLCTIFVFVPASMYPKKPTEKHAIPRFFRIGACVVLVAAFAATGHFLTAAAETWAIFCGLIIAENTKKAAAEPTNAQ